jgi:RNA polymerase sigma-70 factor (ECF subfamily)
MRSPPEDVARLLNMASQGDAEAGAAFSALIYDELRNLARRHMRNERRGHLMQPTALAHDALMGLLRQEHANWQNREQIFGVAVRLMRRILVDWARERLARKRGAGARPIALDEQLLMSDERSEMLVAIDDALRELQEIDLRQAQIVELRFFGGFTVEETAKQLGVSEKTVDRDWKLAKDWLFSEVRGRP